MNIYNFTNLKKRAFFIFCINFFFTINITFAQDNDHIFPAAASAKKYIDFDKQGFIINGKKTFLASAGLEYARIPHELWYDRLMRLKRDGFNCVEVYNFWDFHEPHEGQFDFSGDHDLDAFLKLVKKLGMYATCRVGPYYCAEWSFGGYPIWLHFKDSLKVRVPNAVFEKYADRFLDKLMPVVCSNQIDHGGAVILVQLENEHNAGWGTKMPNQYFKHLQEKALALGLHVPYFFSGLHHGGDPAGNGTTAFDDPTRPNPWYNTEFWSVWYNYYGSTQKDADEFGRRTWKIIAHGGGGYNYYMAHGGSNFGYTNNDEDAASYDYGAAVGQTGDLRPIYYQFKRNALFARSFESVLANASDASARYKNFTTDTVLRIYARHSNNGDIAFIDNPGKSEQDMQVNIGGQLLPAKGTLKLAPGEIMPVVESYKISPEVMMDWAVTRVLGIEVQGNTHNIVIYGQGGSLGSLKFSSGKAMQLLSGKKDFLPLANSIVLNVKFDEKQPRVYSFKAGNDMVRIIALSTKLSDYTWFADAGGKTYIVTGPEYLKEIAFKDKHLQLSIEHFWANAEQPQAWVFTAGSVISSRSIAIDADRPHTEHLALGSTWQVSNASAAAQPGYDDSKWLKSKTVALQMGADDDLSPFAWYRTTINLSRAGDYNLQVRNGGDRAIVYVDGKNIATAKIPGNIELKGLTAGSHTLAIYTAHYGRVKLYNYYGPVQYKDAKGLSGQLVLQKNAPEYLTAWKVLPAYRKSSVDTIPLFTNAPDYRTGDDLFDKKKGYRWLQAVIPAADSDKPQAIYLRSMPSNAAVFLNGKPVVVNDDGAPGHLITLKGGDNTISIFIANEHGGNRKMTFNTPVELLKANPDDIPLINWSMKGGPGDPMAITDWKPLQANDTFDRPMWFNNTFTVPKPGSSVMMWRVNIQHLGHGSVWVNGHNLGRYPEKIPIDGIYIPECWLHTGVNRMMIYDEDGTNPGKVTIDAEKASSREIQSLTL